MNKVIFIFYVLLGILMTACTQNNGHLGPLFGSWSLVGLTEDGKPVELEDKTVFSFQNELVRVVKIEEFPNQSETRYGNFTHSGDQLTLKFQKDPTP